MNRIYNNYEENEDQRYVAKDFESPLGGNKYYFQAKNRDLNMKKNHESANRVYSCNNDDLSIEVRVRGDSAKEQYYSQNYYSRDNYYMMDNSCQYNNDYPSLYNSYYNNQHYNNYNQNNNYNYCNDYGQKKEYYENDECNEYSPNKEYNKSYEMQNNQYNLKSEFTRNNNYKNNYYDTYENGYYNGYCNYNNINNYENNKNNMNNQCYSNNDYYGVEDNNLNVNRSNNIYNSLNNWENNSYENSYYKNIEDNNNVIDDDSNNDVINYDKNNYCYEKEINNVITNGNLDNKCSYEDINNKTIQQNISILNVYSDGIVDGVFKDKYGMRGEHKIKNMPAYSIPLGWSCGPRETQAYALSIMNYDSVPIFGFPWIHWLVADIPAHNTFLKENISRHERFFTEGLSSFAEGYLVRLGELSDIRVPNEFAIGYGGFIPINKPNTYIIKVYALSATINLRRGFTYNEMLEAMEGKVLAHGILKAIYNN